MFEFTVQIFCALRNFAPPPRFISAVYTLEGGADCRLAAYTLPWTLDPSYSSFRYSFPSFKYIKPLCTLHDRSIQQKSEEKNLIFETCKPEISRTDRGFYNFSLNVCVYYLLLNKILFDRGFSKNEKTGVSIDCFN